MAGSFIDTNVLIYFASRDAAKADRAETIIRDGGIVSVQVLNEFANVARRKMRLSWTETHDLLSVIRALLAVHDVTTEIHEIGLSLAERHEFSVYDALIVASALHAKCDTFWSEDMQHGMLIENRLSIVNPFS